MTPTSTSPAPSPARTRTARTTTRLRNPQRPAPTPDPPRRRHPSRVRAPIRTQAPVHRREVVRRPLRLQPDRWVSASGDSALAGMLPDRVEVVEDGEPGVRFDRGVAVIAPQWRERGVDMAYHDVVTRGSPLHLVDAEERPPVVEGDVRRRGEHG